MDWLSGLRRLFQKQPVYDLDRAVVVVFAHLPPGARQDLDHADIETILKLGLRYQDESGPSEGQTAGAMDLVQYIKDKARIREREFSEEHIKAVLEAEQIYMKQAGIIDG